MSDEGTTGSGAGPGWATMAPRQTPPDSTGDPT